MVNFLTLLFNELNDYNVNYAVLRNFSDLPHSCSGSDLDILVDGNDVDKFYYVLDNTLSANNLHIVAKYGRITPRLCILGKLEEGWGGVQIDLHAGFLPYKTENLFSPSFVLSRKIKYNDIWVLNDDDAEAISFLKELLYNLKVKDSTYSYLQKRWSEISVVILVELKLIYGEQFIELFSTLMQQSHDEKTIYKLGIYARKCLFNSTAKQIKSLIHQFKKIRRIFNPPGFTIAFLGVDGSGKSTLIDNVKGYLTEPFHQSVFVEHMRPNVIPNIAQLKNNDQVIDYSQPHDNKRISRVMSVPRLCYYGFDYIFGYWFKIHKSIVKKSAVWIFDRYHYDYLIDNKRVKINLPNWCMSFWHSLLPKPDLILCLGTEAQIIFRRKPELSLKEIERQVNSLKHLEHIENKAFWVDTGSTVNESIDCAMEIIVESMRSRLESNNVKF